MGNLRSLLLSALLPRYVLGKFFAKVPEVKLLGLEDSSRNDVMSNIAPAAEQRIALARGFRCIAYDDGR
jgi:hypothetical protein